ncbi:MAG: SUMF1/EgtB/PvdO family nonheme iron enzyme, partial [Chitinispirillaceae bacterium]|nr:SUMF1/EgtB/PvdO family nonheme iron enzyme [Chitinispirillaceae bacterium]
MKKTFAGFLAVLTLACCMPERGITRREEVEVNLLISGPGRVVGCPADTVIAKGDTLTLFAEADEGAVFTGWRLGYFTSANPLVLPVTGGMTVEAVFSLRPDAMVFIAARDSEFLMGSADKAAHAYEKPPHPVRFTYDFFIGSREVTAVEYRLIMSGAGGAGEGEDDSLPVTNISWYDAVLYCNARSLQTGYDTVYSYTARCSDTGKCPYILENLEIHYDRFGYRLPTEAEWEYACRAGSDDEFFWGASVQEAGAYAWYFDNAENRLHPVGGKLPNRFGLYDMAGNAAEWANDWLGSFPDSLCIDPVGPGHLTQEQFEASWERPLRGGSYRLSSPFLRSAVRKGPYEMTFSGKQVDIGFRLAMGAFAPPAEGAAEADVPDSLSAVVACNKSDLIALLGTYRIKTAFVYTVGRKDYCAFVDFTQSPLRILRCGNDTAVAAPAISPDGTFIAWSSKSEGSSGTSVITVVSLDDTAFPVTARLPGFLPRWWADPESHDTFLVYTDGASLNSMAQWYREKTLRHRIAAGVLEGTPEVLWSMGSYHGGLSSDGRFLGTAFPTAKLVDLKLNDTNIYYFVPPWNGRDDTPQVCNLSMSPSRASPGEALFLDFGYPSTSSLLGKPYGFHSVAFIANTRLFSPDHVSQWFEAPPEYDRWNFTEWTNYPGAFAALAQTAVEGDDDAVVAVDCATAAFRILIKGKNLRDVAVWIDPRDVSEGDDPYRHFGMYDVPIQTA